MFSDDWRLQIDLHDSSRAATLAERLDAHRLKGDLSEAFHNRVIVTQDGARVFLYAGSREQADSARKVVEEDAQQHGWTVEVDLLRWHPIAEEWENPDVPLPADDNAKRAERKALMAREREDTASRGYPEFEVRVDLPSHRVALHLCQQLREEGLPVLHRWRYLVVGADDEDSAKTLAERIGDEAPAGSQLKVEGTWAAVNSSRSANPFVVLSGLGG